MILDFNTFCILTHHWFSCYFLTILLFIIFFKLLNHFLVMSFLSQFCLLPNLKAYFFGACVYHISTYCHNFYTWLYLCSLNFYYFNFIWFFCAFSCAVCKMHYVHFYRHLKGENLVLNDINICLFCRKTVFSL